MSFFRKIFFVLIILSLLVSCGEDSTKKDPVEFGHITVSLLETTDDNQISISFLTEEEGVSITGASFSSWGFDTDTKIQVSQGCTVDKVLNEFSFTVTCDPLNLTKDYPLRLDLWVTGNWEIVEMNGIVAKRGNDVIYNNLSSQEPFRIINEKK